MSPPVQVNVKLHFCYFGPVIKVNVKCYVLREMNIHILSDLICTNSELASPSYTYYSAFPLHYFFFIFARISTKFGMKVDHGTLTTAFYRSTGASRPAISSLLSVQEPLDHCATARSRRYNKISWQFPPWAFHICPSTLTIICPPCVILYLV